MNPQATALAPAFRDLPELEGEKCAWEYFGADDQLGTLGWVDAATIARAAGSVTSGIVVNLDLPVDFATQLSMARKPMSHVLLDNRMGMDDYVDGYYLQSSSQWDGFRHIRYRDHGYFGGHTRTEFDDSSQLGVGAWAENGIVGRGVLVDVAAWAAAEGVNWCPDERVLITPEILDAALARQGMTIERGDLVMVRTGWLSWLRAIPPERRAELGNVGTMACVGLAPGRETAGWIWDHGVAAVAADNPALEALPMTREDGVLHRRILSLLGVPIGEYWDLDGLATACAEVGRYHGLLVSSPLNLPGGVGTPCNAYMIL